MCLVNKAPDYSGAFIILRTNFPELKAYGLSSPGHMMLIPIGMTFTSGSGNEVVCLAMDLLAKRVVGKSLAQLTQNMSATWRSLVSGQIRWIGPEVSIDLIKITPHLPHVLQLFSANHDFCVERSVAHGYRCRRQCNMGSLGSI